MKHFLLLVGIALALASSAPRVENGETQPVPVRGSGELYAKYCTSCHGKDGRAKTLKAKLNHARDLTDSTWQGNVTDERIFNSIMNGKRKMPAYEKKMSEQEIDSLVAYVRHLKK